MSSNFSAISDTDLIYPFYYDGNQRVAYPQYSQEIINFLNNWLKERRVEQSYEQDKKAFIKDLNKLLKELNTDYYINPKKKFSIERLNSTKKNFFQWSIIAILILVALVSVLSVVFFPWQIFILPLILISFAVYLTRVYPLVGTVLRESSPPIQHLRHEISESYLFSQGLPTGIKPRLAFLSHRLLLLYDALLKDNVLSNNFSTSLQSPRTDGEDFERINLNKRSSDKTLGLFFKSHPCVSPNDQTVNSTNDLA